MGRTISPFLPLGSLQVPVVPPADELKAVQFGGGQNELLGEDGPAQTLVQEAALPPLFFDGEEDVLCVELLRGIVDSGGVAGGDLNAPRRITQVSKLWLRGSKSMHQSRKYRPPGFNPAWAAAKWLSSSSVFCT